MSAGTSTRPPFWVVSAKMALPSRGERRGQVAFDFLGGRVSLHDELTRDGLHADLDFHDSPYAQWASPWSDVRGQPLMPRQASRATSCSADSLGIEPSVLSQYRALTWAMPRSPMESR